MVLVSLFARENVWHARTWLLMFVTWSTRARASALLLDECGATWLSIGPGQWETVWAAVPGRHLARTPRFSFCFCSAPYRKFGKSGHFLPCHVFARSSTVCLLRVYTFIVGALLSPLTRCLIVTLIIFQLPLNLITTTLILIRITMILIRTSMICHCAEYLTVILPAKQCLTSEYQTLSQLRRFHRTLLDQPGRALGTQHTIDQSAWWTSPYRQLPVIPCFHQNT